MDTLLHSILLEKLERYGYRGAIHAIIKNYLSGRWQQVFINGIGSDKIQILTGVPQGSILGPLLFLLHKNDLGTSSGDSKVTMFTDDTRLINAGITSAFLKQKAFDADSDRLAANKITIIADKCEMMIFEPGNQKPLKINDTSLMFKPSCKYLGVQPDNGLRFNQ